MADSKHSDLGIPTRSTARKFMPDSLSADQCEEVLNYLENLGVVFAAKPVAEPEESPFYKVDDADGNTWEPTELRGRWTRIADGVEWTWVNIPQPVTLYREVDTPESAPAESREEVAEAIARLLEQFGENVDGDPIKPDIAAWVAREYGKRNLSPDQVDEAMESESARS